MANYSNNPQNRMNDQGSKVKAELLWFAGVVGTTVGVAVWAYSRRKMTYWERTKRKASQVAATAAEVNPWVGVGAGTALGSAALAYRLRRPKTAMEKATQRAQELSTQTGSKLRPILGLIAATALRAAMATSDPKSRKRMAEKVKDKTANAADQIADRASRTWRRMQTV